MRSQDEKKVRGLEAEVREIQESDKERFTIFLEKFGYQLLIQALSIVIAATLFYAATTNSLDTIKKDVTANAQEINIIKSEGSVPVKIIETKLDDLTKTIAEIKSLQLRFEDKIDDISTHIISN